MTEDQPKCTVVIGDKPILDWTLQTFKEAGLDTPLFIGGYRIDDLRRSYPHLNFCHNDNWQNNNILTSLFYAERHMDEGFICAYSDILFRPSLINRALMHESDIVLGVDTDWRRRYTSRTQHPENDAEKVLAQGDRLVAIGRTIPSEQAIGEFIGVARFSAKGAGLLRRHFHRVRAQQHDGEVWRGGRSFQKSYLIELLQEMIEQGEDLRIVTTAGDYMEIDTEEDYALAQQHWPQRLAREISR